MKTGSKLDVRAGVGRRDDGVDAVGTTTDVHDDVVDGVVVVEVVVEQQVARLEVTERHVDQRGPLGLGRARDLDARLGPGPLDEPRTVETDARCLAAPDVGHADLGLGGVHGGQALRAELPTSTRVTVWEACSIASVTSFAAFWPPTAEAAVIAVSSPARLWLRGGQDALLRSRS